MCVTKLRNFLASKHMNCNFIETTNCIIVSRRLISQLIIFNLCLFCKFFVDFLKILNFLDVDECATNRYNCHSQATCKNNPGGFSCTCNNGYQGNGIECFAGKFALLSCMQK